jgi:hypothetical protein
MGMLSLLLVTDFNGRGPACACAKDASKTRQDSVKDQAETPTAAERMPGVS